jgi:hypothetical protein
MNDEVLSLNESFKKLKEVVNSEININTLFMDTIALANALGEDVYETIDTLIEFARTFKEYDEQKLLAITKTAIIMSQVSDLDVEEINHV